jgi:hypothetical protein
VAEASVSPVLESKLSEASAMLGNLPAVELSDSAFVDLVGGGKEASGRRILLRGLCGGCYTGKFHVYTTTEAVIVDHVSLSDRGSSGKAWPVVVMLPALPRDVFVQYSTIR